MGDLERQRKPRITQLIDAAIAEHADQVYGPLPGVIEKYDPEMQSADVNPTLLRPLVDEDGFELEPEILPVIPGVPIQFPRADVGGAKFFMSWPLKPGDRVGLHVTKWSLDQWKSKEATDPVDPVQLRQFDISDCWAVPGPYPFPQALKEADPDNLVLGLDEAGLQMHMLPDGTLEFRKDGAATEFVIKGNAFQMWWDDTAPTGVAGNYNIHVHPTAMGPSGPPNPPWVVFLSTVLSTFMSINDS